MNNTLKAALLVTSALIATPVFAQTQPVPPEHYTLDSRGVDLVTGYHTYATTEVVIGQLGAGGLSYGRVWTRTGWRDLNAGTINASGNSYTVSIGAVSEIFTRAGSSFSPVSNNGSTLIAVAGGFRFVSSSGDLYSFGTGVSAAQPYVANIAVIEYILKANGERIQYNYFKREYCEGEDPYSSECTDYQYAIRLESITNNYGYQLKYYYTENEVNANNSQYFVNHIAVRGINNAIDYCDPSAPTPCNFTQIWPSVTYNNAFVATQATDQSGRITTYSFGVGGLTGVRFPGSSSDDISMVKTGSLQTTAVTDASGTWSYSYVDSGTTRTTTATGPLGQKLTAVSNQSIGRATSITQATSATTSVTASYAYDSQRRLQRVTQPEGDYAELTYDARGNVTQTLYVPKPGSGLGNLTTTASFPASCSNPVTCNKPTSTTDARGAVTDYAWNGTHGGLESVTLPAPAPGAVRPQTRIAYAAQTAYIKDWAGAIVASPTSITLPVSVSQCATNAAPTCVGTTDEVRQTVQYGAPGVANNLLPTVVTQQDGTGALSASTTMTYTANGDVASVDGPLPGSDDTTYYRYDTARRQIGVIGPDPDGPSGSLLRRAQRTTYDVAGRPTQVEQGVVNGITDGDWNGFNSLQQQLTAYDAFGRPVITASHGGGQAHAVTHVSYDAAGRQSCVATRMNPAAFNSLPGSACELGAQGAYGQDRITRYEYDEAGRLKQSTSGYLSTSPITEQATYTANGKPLTLKDGNGNLSTMVYDGFDRLVQLNYPDAATGSGTSSSVDFQQYGYDPNGNVIGFRNRGGEVINATYDALNRQISMGGSAIADRNFSYDNLNRLKTMTFASGGASMTNTYDGLGRLASQAQAGVGTMSYVYDSAGRKTRMSWPDGFFVNYEYNLANDLIVVRENGAPDWALAWWAYDNLGRRMAQGRANGATTSWSYDAAGRLAALTNDLAGTANDVTLNLAYNPAGQIVTRTLSNPAYAYQPGVGNTAYANNGKNQVTSVNGAGVGYDGRQNITSVPGLGSYGYNGSNELTSATVGGATTGLSYDPAGRLYQSGSTRFLYDGQQVVGEYNTSGGLLRRYVPGLGLDNVVTAYEGAGYDRRWLLSDERGSVVSITDGAANALTTNTYDEYGQPGSANSGRFQYTGQMWLPQAQLYHYRARAYAPQLGRFMQTDPIGYKAGMNVYAYVGADPINLIDPLGLEEVTDVDEVVVSAKRRVKRGVVYIGPIVVSGGRGSHGTGGGRLASPNGPFTCPASAVVAAEAEALAQANRRGEAGFRARESGAEVVRVGAGWMYGPITVGPLYRGQVEISDALATNPDRYGRVGATWHSHPTQQASFMDPSDRALRQWGADYGSGNYLTYVTARVGDSPAWNLISHGPPTVPDVPGQVVNRENPCP